MVTSVGESNTAVQLIAQQLFYMLSVFQAFSIAKSLPLGL